VEQARARKSHNAFTRYGGSAHAALLLLLIVIWVLLGDHLLTVGF
jgi:hypothetical protein